MSDSTTSPTTTVRCGTCGAPPKESETTTAAEPVTHCEWCGAEYPVPGGQ